MKLPHTALGVFYTTHLLGIIYKLRYLIGTHRVLLHLQCKAAHVLISTVIYSIDDWQRQLTLNHIITCRLANLCRVIIVEDVVAYLEDNAEVLTELLRRLHFLLRRSRRQCSDAGTRLKQSRGLLLYHVIIYILRDILASDVRQLEYLAIRQRASQLGKISHNLLRMSTSYAQKGCRKDVVAHKHRHLIVISGVDRSLTTTLLTLIHHVIMNERSRVEQLQSHGSILRSLVDSAEVLSHKQYQHRAHTLACTLADVLQRRAEQSVLVRERLVEKTYKVGEFRLYRVLND